MDEAKRADRAVRPRFKATAPPANSRAAKRRSKPTAEKAKGRAGTPRPRPSAPPANSQIAKHRSQPGAPPANSRTAKHRSKASSARANSRAAKHRLPSQAASANSRAARHRSNASSRKARATMTSTFLGRKDHDPRSRGGSLQTRRGRAPIAVQNTRVVRPLGRSTEVNQTLRRSPMSQSPRAVAEHHADLAVVQDRVDVAFTELGVHHQLALAKVLVHAVLGECVEGLA